MRSEDDDMGRGEDDDMGSEDDEWGARITTLFFPRIHSRRAPARGVQRPPRQVPANPPHLDPYLSVDLSPEIHPLMPDQSRFVEPFPLRIEQVTLSGQRVRLVPMQPDHAEALWNAANFPAIWELTGTSPMRSLDDIRRYMNTALTERDAGTAVPFITTDAITGEIIGSTRFANISAADRRVEIGWTWLRPDRHRTAANGEAKALMLQQAFDRWGALRVEIKTDVRNARSRAAIERLGASFEGIHRQHMIVRDGRVRDTVYYSVLDTEWRDPSHRVHQVALTYGITPAPAFTR